MGWSTVPQLLLAEPYTTALYSRVEGVGLNLLRQAGVGKVVFRHNQQAAGVLVNAVDDSRARPRR